jgi:hypothetical protein
MRVLLKLFAMIAALYPTTAGAQCAAPDFRNVSFRDIRDLSSYAFLSKVREDDYKLHSQKFKGEMVIPYINVPASGDFQQMKMQLNQVQRLTKIDITQQHTETLLDIGWSQLGLEAYKHCLNTQKSESVVIEHLKGTDPFSEELIVSVTWFHRTNAPAKEIKSIICLGCDYAGEIAKGSLVEPGISKLLTLKRRPDSNLSLVVSFDGLLGQFHLPKKPKNPTIREEFWIVTATAAKAAPGPRQFLLANDKFCLPSPASNFQIDVGSKNFKLKDNEEFVIGTATQRKTGEQGRQGYSRDPEPGSVREREVCWQLEVVSQNIDYGHYSGTYRFSVKIATPTGQ